MKKLLFILSLSIISLSCKKQHTEADKIDLKEEGKLTIRESKLYIAQTLAKALEKEPVLRGYLKTEALKKFDNDFDVFYQTVKNVSLSDGETFHSKLIKYASSKDSLSYSIEALPLLTFLLPELPDFNAENWDAANVIPFVAVEPESYSTKENIKAFYGQNQKFDIPFGLVPAEATIVIKDNERIIVNKGNNSYTKGASKNSLVSTNSVVNNSSTTFLRSDGMSFSFADEVFNGIKKKVSTESKKEVMGRGDGGGTTTPPSINMMEKTSVVQHIIDAVDSKTEWQRDNIYYGINPGAGINSGKLRDNIQECLTYIRFADGKQSYENLGRNPNDPQPVDDTPIYQQWTNGSYEFRLTTLINTKNGPGSLFNQVFYIKPSDLFLLGYESGGGRGGNGEGPRPNFKKPFVKEALTYRFPDPIQISTWDLENKAFGWKIGLSKFNPAQTTTQVVGNTTEYATNFELNIGLGEKFKVGPKFGGSAKFTNTQQYTYSRTFGPNDLGDKDIYFSDPVYIKYIHYQGGPDGGGIMYTPNEVFLGSVYLTIEPRLKYKLP